MAWNGVLVGLWDGESGGVGRDEDTVVGEVETAIDPDAVVAHRNCGAGRVFGELIGHGES